MSRTYRVVFTPEAEIALEVAYRWIENSIPERATAWANGFIAAIESLGSFPTRCPSAPESKFFSIKIRHLLYGPRGHRYRALFTIEGDAVNVLFIRHYAQDWLHPSANE